MSLTIGLVQPNTGIDPVRGAAALAEAVGRLAARGAQMIFTPEMSGRLDRDRARMAASLHDETGDPVLMAMREAAARHGVWVQLGSLALAGGSEGRLLNRGFVIDDRGGVVAAYDKIHLFDVDLPGGERYRESTAYAPGGRAVVAATPWGGLGLSICYDVRFPALYGALARAGARMIAVPAAFTRPTGRAHWHVLLRARAIETGSFVIAAAQTGEHEDGRATYGHSLVVSPWGEMLLEMGEAPGEAICALDLNAVDEARGRVPSLRHGRDWTGPDPLP
jgi:predicted amidohydrolase